MTKEQETLFMNNTGLIKNMAHKYSRITQSMDFDDLYQAGSQGLINAILKYNENLGIKFSTYASTCIKNAIINEIQYTDRMIRIPLPMQELLTRYDSELQKTGISIDDFVKKYNLQKFAFQQAYKANTYPTYLEQKVTQTDKEVDELINVIMDENTNNCVEFNLLYNEMTSDIYQMINELKKDKSVSERDINILLYYYGFYGPGKTLKEISSIYNITKSRVQQVLERLLKKLRYINENAKEHISSCSEYDFSHYDENYELSL